MNIQVSVTEASSTITASITNGKVYVYLDHGSCLFLTTSEAVDLVDAIACVLADIESSAMPIPL